MKKLTDNQEEVKNIRLSLNMTQLQFSKHIGVHQRTVSSWEQGVRNPRDITMNYIKNVTKKSKIKSK